MLKFKLYFLTTLSVINVVESNGDNTVPHDDKTTFEWFKFKYMYIFGLKNYVLIMGLCVWKYVYYVIHILQEFSDFQWILCGYFFSKL